MCSDNEKAKANMKDELKPGARNLIRFIEATVLACMGIVILSGLLSAIAAQKQFEAFDGNCIYSSNISFILRNASKEIKLNGPTKKPDENHPVNTTTASNNSSEIALQAPSPSRKRRAKKIKHIFKSLDTEYVDDNEEDFEEDNEPEKKYKVDVDKSMVRLKADYEFLSTMQVDTIKSTWAQLTFCEYVLYNPILSSIAGMICVTMLVLFNAAGKSSIEWGIPQPWRIVFPAVISFSIMTIVSVAHLVLMKNATKEFCTGLAQNLTEKEIACEVLIDSLKPIIINDSVPIGAYYDIHNITIKITLAAWIIALLLMVLRMFFVIDFRLVRVTVSTFSQQTQKPQKSDTSSSDSEELEQKSEHFNKNTATRLLDPNTRPKSGSTPDDLDDFQSAYSDPDGTTLKQPSSLEPLITEKKEY